MWRDICFGGYKAGDLCQLGISLVKYGKSSWISISNKFQWELRQAAVHRWYHLPNLSCWMALQPRNSLPLEVASVQELGCPDGKLDRSESRFTYTIHRFTAPFFPLQNVQTCDSAGRMRTLSHCSRAVVEGKDYILKSQISKRLRIRLSQIPTYKMFFDPPIHTSH